MKTLIRGSEVVFHDEVREANVLIENGIILDVDANPQASCDHLVHAEGRVLLPGVVDDQVHFREPGLTHKEDLEHATKACAKGGVTTFFEMPNTNPTTTTVERLHEKLQRASECSLVNYAFYMGATEDNLEDLQAARRTPGIKIFIGSSTGNLLVDEQAALERIFGETSLPITAHCEDETTVSENAFRYRNSTDVADHSRVRDHDAAYLATDRAIKLAVKYQHRFHVLHVSTAKELELIKPQQGLVTAEVCHHHLFFNTADYDRLGARIKVNPSIKLAEDNSRLWQALLDGTIQVIATDHAPHTLEEKAEPYPKCPSGLPSIENSLALMLDRVNQGACTLSQVAHWMCDAPARTWDLIGRGRIEEGYAGDVVLVDMNLKQTILDENQVTKCRWSPWHGTTLQGWPVKTWVNGNLVYRREDDAPWFASTDAGAVGDEAKFDHSLGGYWAERNPVA